MSIKNMKPQTPLSVVVQNGELVIRIGVNSLVCATAYGDASHQFDDEAGEYIRNFAITDACQFAKDVALQMQREEEDGSTPLSDLLDKMAQAAIDDGSLGVEFNQRVLYGERLLSEKWGEA
jgi:hypothetical protein